MGPWQAISPLAVLLENLLDPSLQACVDAKELHFSMTAKECQSHELKTDAMGRTPALCRQIQCNLSVSCSCWCYGSNKLVLMNINKLGLMPCPQILHIVLEAQFGNQDNCAIVPLSWNNSGLFGELGRMWREHPNHEWLQELLLTPSFLLDVILSYLENHVCKFPPRSKGKCM